MGKRRPLRERLEEKIDKDRIGTGCWVWTASGTQAGYGQIWSGNTQRPAHRVSYEIHVGEIPDGLYLDHLCRNPCCVNPDHLEPVTPYENSRRGLPITFENGRCRRGHVLADVGIDRGTCVACRRAYKARWYRENQERIRVERAERYRTDDAFRQSALDRARRRHVENRDDPEYKRKALERSRAYDRRKRAERQGAAQ